MVETVAELERLLRGLLTGEHTSLMLSFNDGHACNYVDARTYYEEWAQEEDTGWVSVEEREKALTTNSVWVCHWYPLTPIGFYQLKASSLQALLEALSGETEAGR